MQPGRPAGVDFAESCGGGAAERSTLIWGRGCRAGAGFPREAAARVLLSLPGAAAREENGARADRPATPTLSAPLPPPGLCGATPPPPGPGGFWP